MIDYRHFDGVEARDVLREALLWSSYEVVNPSNTDRCVAAYDGDKLVGVFGYSRGEELSWVPASAKRMLNAEGTHVLPAYRKRGIGTELWCRAIERWDAGCVLVFVVSARAVSMLQRVEKRMRGVEIIATFSHGPRGGTMRSEKVWRERHRLAG